MLKKSKTKNALRKISSLLLSGILFCTCAIHSYAAASKITADAAGVNNYSLCNSDNVAGTQYVDGLMLGLQEKYHPKGIPVEFSILQNNYCTRSSVLAAAKKDATMLVFAGHGYDQNLTGVTTGNSWHLNANANSKSHKNLSSGEGNSEVNIFSYNLSQNKHRYVVAYTCSFLTNNGSQTKVQNLYKINARVLCGFASKMYLDSREGLYFGRLLGKESVRSAFLNAASMYQPQIYVEGHPNYIVNARAMGLNDAFYEKVDAGKPTAPSYSSNPNAYSILQTVEIPQKNNYDPGYN